MRPAIRAGDTEKTIDMWRNICAIEMQEKKVWLAQLRCVNK